MYQILKEKVQEIIKNKEQKMVDYVGINLDTQGNKKYKIYYYNDCKSNSNLNNENNISKLVDSLKQDDLISMGLKVDDNNSGLSRYELSVKLNEDEKVKELLEKLSKYSSLINKNIKEILELAQIEVLPNCKYKYAALYFIGLISKYEEICAVKMHYMTRKEINYQTIYDNNYYIKYLRNLHISELDKVLDLVEVMLNDKVGNLQLMGVDYFVNQPSKYKIYLELNNKSIKYFQEFLAKTNISGIDKIINELENVKQYTNEMKSLDLSIIALCYDQNNNFSINLYYKMKEDERNV